MRCARWHRSPASGDALLDELASDNVYVFFKNFAKDPRARASQDDYLNDASRGRLPNVSFMIPSFTLGIDEHPPADVQVGMRLRSR